ncbi:MFS transporter [Streptomyces echinatus]|uniref:Putative MFS family arabinose efflux permease n=1 Tax=Streptomyces echinatus TaxID=67293 RepID=A0A7W9UMV8_9ACTN|nr:MFS transporter [Streptomyces echinatus]MBB5924617.1 putative MFS family arabinose efflux permease [Streptomyces echinatus]
MPQQTTQDTPVPQQTAQDTPTRPGRRRFAGYRRLFGLPGARAFTAGNLLARLPMGMFSVSAVVMIAGARGSYALAGAVTATGLAATAVAGPWLARLVDRHGQARIALPATAVSALGSLALLLCVRRDAPDWTLFAAYACTAATPNIGGLSRARWAHLLRDEPGTLHAANAFEQAADELCFMLGPVLASFLTGTFFPEAGTLVGAVLLLAGMALFTAQRATEPPPRARSKAPSPLRSPGVPALLVCFTATGAVFGSMEVVTIAYADAGGRRAAAGAVLALQAAGSCAAGLVYGARKPAAPRLHRCLAAMAALMTLPWAAASTGSLGVLAGALLVAGMATAPTMVTAMTLVQRRTPDDRLNEGMSLVVTGLLIGIACGSATGGWATERLSPVAAFGVPATAAALALLVSLAPEAARRVTVRGFPQATGGHRSTCARDSISVRPLTDGDRK